MPCVAAKLPAVSGDEGVASLEIAIRCLESPARPAASTMRKGPRRRRRLIVFTGRLSSIQHVQRASMNQHMQLEPIPFIDISAQRRRLGKSIDDAVARVLDHCQFINGPEVTALEKALADYSGAKHVVSCASGTDALLMVLMAKNVGPGDAVLCPTFTFCATGEVVTLTGATPVFVDVDEETFNIDVDSLKRGNCDGARPRAEAGGRDPGRPVRPERGSRCDRRGRRG